MAPKAKKTSHFRSDSDPGSRVVKLPVSRASRSHEATGRERPGRRINLELPEKAAGQLDWLQEATGAVTTAEVIRNALKFYYGFVKETESGGTITITNSDGERLKFV